MTIIDAGAIGDAAPRIPRVFRDTPQYVSEPLSARLGVPTLVKVETVNPIGCFKGRGTWLAVEQLFQSGTVTPRRGIVVASAGNFGQGVAYAGRALGIPVTVCAATTASAFKVAAIRQLGAEVRLRGADFDAARDAARHLGEERDWHLLVDGQDPWITIGAGTIGLELSRGVDAGELPAIAECLVPLGNGALLGGIATWLRHASPDTRMIGVVAAAAPAMALSWRAARPVQTATAETVADGIAVRVPVPEALGPLLEVVDEVVEVSEAEILDATQQLGAMLPLRLETSAAVGWAAALARSRPAGGVALVLTGGNVGP